ncbi:type VI secretion system-associated FHA domain protein TagH [Billgrantia montanilacus]|uniref:Type VI secretion system-associated FHA domain protein TagH n=1 Tax=Billgrantia montanilacus TaxID=2282305 RepID=A0A368TVN6_9GAMM|nr:type VI secretion system-associated FHA domain protein TagH [Halomonas montanilacus]RCV88869.1 type VI secretion system-associated FHA domain protein TagH [Halomonas montanilacus]
MQASYPHATEHHVAAHTAITLVVINSERLEGRSTSSHVFHEAGGTLGSADSDDWLLQDHAGRIRPGHAEIQRQDGRFCLVDRSGHTFINHATLPLGRDRRVALRDGDELRLGEYHLRVHLGDRQAGLPGAQPLTALIDEEQEALPGQGMPLVHSMAQGSIAAARQDDPMEALGEVTPGASHQDPITALKHPDEETIDFTDPLLEELEGAGANGASHYPQVRRGKPSGKSTIQAYEDNNAMSRDMDERLLNDLERSVGEQLEDRWQESSPAVAGHMGADPLMRALGANLRFHDSEEQQAFLAEAGNTLRAAIEGLQALHQAQDDSRYPLRDRRLQPIEDNPLRLGQPYVDTVETMFSARRSPVHLSAPAAVAECLAHQGQHQAAVEEAIGQALQSILDAFAPDALLKRFHAYRGAGNRLDDEGGWAWDMYRHYYQELNSGRQQGFAKLFWEVFEQAYDQSVRRQQREEA